MIWVRYVEKKNGMLVLMINKRKQNPHIPSYQGVTEAEAMEVRPALLPECGKGHQHGISNVLQPIDWPNRQKIKWA